ncbi:MAG: bifunctional phosphoribosylaminoimidazolecarboxamide formyltransferase/IMP cyclohydrolase [Endomicrobiales bacterium]|nr:bifunctional phosphoribosylaminoimidazolecarboxamide formyltransferase/IMP cyclohydrolase [Endomicrobiales bacterium]
MRLKRALISVSDKTGITEFAKELASLGIEIVSSGGTSRTLSENGVPCREISEITGFPEILDGRVKTLNPKVHGGILSVRDNKDHEEELKKHGIEPIDIVAVNLYPFEKTAEKHAKTKGGKVHEDVIENIDIGGVALIRAAAKNFNDVLVVCDSSDYKKVTAALKSGDVPYEFRAELAAKAFRHTAYYDSVISGYLSREKFPSQFSLAMSRTASLRYGENPHQGAALYATPSHDSRPKIVQAGQKQGKELSYNNYLDMDSALNLVLEFERPACVIMKHNNPCGCAEGADLKEAYLKALACDPVSAYGGVISVNREVDEKLASEIVKVFTECLVSPSYAQGAMDIFAAKKNMRLLELPHIAKYRPGEDEIAELRMISGGMLVQDKDLKLLEEMRPVTKAVPDESLRESLEFAMKVCKNVKSNAIILARGTQTAGVGAGQMSRIDALKIASQKMSEAKFSEDTLRLPLVLASDAFFPFPDVVNEAAKLGVKAIIQPGGSIRDKESIEAADANGIAMVFTSMRHFRH